MQHLIQKAIEQKRLLSFEYNDKLRIVEPHCLGYNKNEALRVEAHAAAAAQPSACSVPAIQPPPTTRSPA